MDREVLAEVRELAGQGAAGKLRSYLPDGDVLDPFGRPFSAFVDCVTQIRDGAVRHLSSRVEYRRL